MSNITQCKDLSERGDLCESLVRSIPTSEKLTFIRLVRSVCT